MLNDPRLENPHRDIPLIRENTTLPTSPGRLKVVDTKESQGRPRFGSLGFSVSLQRRVDVSKRSRRVEPWIWFVARSILGVWQCCFWIGFGVSNISLRDCGGVL